jgi:UDP-N-acetylmuramoylalanine--D-glutamate ligase
MIPVTTFAGRLVAVFGLGGSGLATLRALVAGGAMVAAWDDSATGRDAAAKAGFPLVDLSTADWSQISALVLAPGVPLTHPEPHWVVNKAKAASVEIIGDIELFCRERNKHCASVCANDAHCSDAPFIAITGTNGKSTTTALIAHILRAAGHDVQMGGNIGVPILALEPPTGASGLAREHQSQPNRFYVIEMSSFQIDLTPSVNPTVGVLLNITPDHIDRHGTIEAYAAVKARLVEAAQHVIIGAGDEGCRDIAARLKKDGRSVVSIAADDGGRYCYRSGTIVRGDERGLLVDLARITTLRGSHNGENAAAAFAALELLGIDDATIARHMHTYPGLPHRMDEIARLGGVLFINDSKATNADSTEKALKSFPSDVFWIVGGKAKEGGIEPLREYFPGIVRAYTIGASADDFGRSMDGDVAIVPCGTLDVAVARASADAVAYCQGQPLLAYNVQGTGGVGTWPPGTPLGHLNSSRETAVVLLSPACASYDQFKNFEDRGDQFRALVAKLSGVVMRGKP